MAREPRRAPAGGPDAGARLRLERQPEQAHLAPRRARSRRPRGRAARTVRGPLCCLGRRFAHAATASAPRPSRALPASPRSTPSGSPRLSSCVCWTAARAAGCAIASYACTRAVWCSTTVASSTAFWPTRPAPRSGCPCSSTAVWSAARTSRSGAPACWARGAAMTRRTGRHRDPRRAVRRRLARAAVRLRHAPAGRKRLAPDGAARRGVRGDPPARHVVRHRPWATPRCAPAPGWACPASCCGSGPPRTRCRCSTSTRARTTAACASCCPTGGSPGRTSGPRRCKGMSELPDGWDVHQIR